MGECTREYKSFLPACLLACLPICLSICLPACLYMVSVPEMHAAALCVMHTCLVLQSWLGKQICLLKACLKQAVGQDQHCITCMS